MYFKLLIISIWVSIQVVGQQNDVGIKFEQNLEWKEILEKARRENKLVFIDCYTSWCKPCKQMDKFVYTDNSLGKFINDRFIAVKVQMDTNAFNDMKMRKNAREVYTKFKVDGYPTLLFLNANGDLIHNQMGYKGINDFITTAQTAVTSDRLSYNTSLEDYKNGKRHVELMEGLAIYAKSLGQDSLAKVIAEDYISRLEKDKLLSNDKILFILNVAKNRRLADSLASFYKIQYLDKQPKNKVYTRENLIFIDKFQNLIRSDDSFFDLCYNHPIEADSIVGSADWAKAIVDWVVVREQLQHPLFNYGEPTKKSVDWNKLQHNISAKYSKINARLMVANYKISYYKTIKKWDEYVKAIIDRVDRYWTSISNPGEEDFDLNNYAWEVFLYSENNKELYKALRWSDSAIRLCNTANKSNWMDTKANILYKLGRRSDAIALEEKAAAMDPMSNEIKRILAKMKRNEPTWPLPEGANN
jgi:thioredoxin-related protein